MPESSKPSALYITSVEKALRVFQAFDREHAALSLSDLAKLTQLSLPNIQRLTYTLTRLGYLARDPQSKRYALTPRTLDVGFRYLQASPLLDRAAPHLAELNRRTEETVNLTVLDGADVVYIARHRGFHSIGINMYIGARLPAFATGIGQAMLAFLPVRDAIARIDARERPPYTRYTITDREALLRKLQRVRRLGYALEDQEMFLGGISVAVPILDPAGQPLAAVNVAVPVSRFSAAQAEQRFAQLVLETARIISGPIAHRASPAARATRVRAPARRPPDAPLG
jgi:IclR family transcriptional regulator, pca regulon regulatory protein